MIHGLSQMKSNLKVNIDKADLKRGVRLVVKIGTSVITNNKNAMAAGPITINSGVTVTVGSGETLTIV